MAETGRPEFGSLVDAGGTKTNYLEAGEGPPVVLLHGSGPGVTAYANWRLTIPVLSQRFQVLAPDLVGFGYTERPDGITYGLRAWVDHVAAFLDALELDRVSLVGNSFGGAIALRLAAEQPERIRRLVLMGSMGVSFPITDGLDSVWGYEPSFETMRRILDLFAHSRDLVTDELAEVRYRASVEPGFQETFSAMFPAPRQQGIEDLVTPEDVIASVPHETMIVHGREDRIIPMDNAYRLLGLLPNAELHVFGRCGHWTQIEWHDEFCALLARFLGRPENSRRAS